MGRMTTHWDALAAPAIDDTKGRQHPVALRCAGPAAAFSAQAGDMLFDYSKTNIDADTRDALLALAEAADVAGKREAMFSGADDQRDRRPRRAAHRAAQPRWRTGHGARARM